MTIYTVEDIKEQKTLHKTEDYMNAKAYADARCSMSNRKRHYRVIKQEDVYVTSTLEEAINNKTS